MIEYLPLVLTGLGLTASIIYYASVLRNANKTRQTQLFMNIYDKWSGEELSQAYRILRTIKFNDYNEFESFWKNDDPNNIEWSAAGKLAGFYEGVGVLVKEKLIDIRLIALLMKGRTTQYYEMMKPYVVRYRQENNSDTFLIETEYLYNKLTKYIQEHPNYRNE